MPVTTNKGLCSVEISSGGIAVAYVPDPTTSEIAICEFHPYQSNGQINNDLLHENLEKIVSKHNLRKIQCNWVLHPDYYHLTLVDTPNVPQTEYKTAVRWQIKDIITYPLEDLSIDIFYPDETEKVLKKVFVIAAQNSFLKNIVNIIQECNLEPRAIDIREFAIRNLIAKLAHQDETIGLLSLVDESCLLVLVKQNNIRFVRRIPVGLKKIVSDNYTYLITELQRSFSYCQTELKQEVPTRIFVPPKLEINTNITQNIAKNLNKEVSILDLQNIVSFKTPIDQTTEFNCWVVIGGALRNTIID